MNLPIFGFLFGTKPEQTPFTTRISRREVCMPCGGFLNTGRHPALSREQLNRVEARRRHFDVSLDAHAGVHTPKGEACALCDGRMTSMSMEATFRSPA